MIESRLQSFPETITLKYSHQALIVIKITIHSIRASKTGP